MSELEAVIRQLVENVVRDEVARLAPQWEWADVAEAARLLGVTPKAVYSKIDRGVLSAHRFDGRVYLSRRELDAAVRNSGSES